MRQIVLDTETTGLDPQSGHRIIEIGCVELENRRLTGNNLHLYINPERDIDEGALQVHGITVEFLADKPTFAQVAEQFMSFVRGAELVIHNAPFDIGFLDHELTRLGEHWGKVADVCGVLDTLKLARDLHPGQKNSLDALCRRYDVDNGHRELHGALLDAEILADVYLAMTGGQTRLSLGSERGEQGADVAEAVRRLDPRRAQLIVVRAAASELERHQAKLAAITERNGQRTLWEELEGSREPH